MLGVEQTQERRPELVDGDAVGLPAPAVEPSARMLFELSEARRPVNLKERVKDRVSRNTLSSSSSTCCTKHTASRKYCVWRRACVPGAVV